MAYDLATYETILQRDARAAAQYLGKLRAAHAREGKPLPAWAVPVVRPPVAPPPEPVPLVIPLELSSWRAESSFRGFSLSADGRVRLVDWRGGEVTARFSAVADALTAIAAGTVKWRATPRKVDPRHQRSNKAIGT